MKNRIITISTREIKQSYKRFLSLLIMSFLGVAVFVGMRLSANTMLYSLDKYYDDSNVYDLEIISTLGLTDDDVQELEKLNIVEKATGQHFKDVYYKNKNIDYVMRFISITSNTNKINITKGRLPKNNKEIIVEDYLLKTTNLKIGDMLTISDDDNNLTNNTFKIVGTVNSPIYLVVGSPALNRGSTTLGTGSVNYYAYTTNDLYNMDYYSEIYLNIKGANKLITSEKKYKDLINHSLKSVNKVKKEREQQRYLDIYNKALEKIKEKEDEGNRQLEEANKILINAKYELDNGLNKLNDSSSIIENAKKQLVIGENELKEKEKQIEYGYKQVNIIKEQINNGKQQINEELKKYYLTIEDILTLIDIWNQKIVPKESLKNIIKSDCKYKQEFDYIIDYIYDNGYNELIDEYFKTGYQDTKQEIINIIPKEIPYYDEIVDYINNLNIDEIKNDILVSIINTDKVENLKKYIPTCINNYDKIINYIDKYIDNVEMIKKLIDNILKIKENESIVENKEIELKQAKNLLNEKNNEFINYKQELQNKEYLLKMSYKLYYEKLKSYDEGIIEYKNQRFDFEKRINEAKEKLKSIEKPIWYINTRDDNSDYSSYMGIGESIDKLAKAFPLIFFIVAIFMSIMCMSRMALEDRIEIGTLKALGFNNKHIITKYFIYSSLATIIGGVLGSIFGTFFLTYFIWKMYRILYNIPVYELYFNSLVAILGTFVALLCISGSSILTVRNIVKENTSLLLRPKAPKTAKSFIFEKTKLWKKIKFSNKVTIKNILRYKKRVLMTVIGITGCTILLLTGYGIRDSIINISPKQFKDIIVYDDLINYSEKYTYDEKLLKDKHIKYVLNGKLTKVSVNNNSVNVVAIDDPSISNNIFKPYSIYNKKEIKLTDNKIIISSKLASINKLKKGDTVVIETNDRKKYKLMISDIFENYVGHYIIMNKNTYNKEIGKYKINMSYIKLTNKKYEKKITTNLMKKDYVTFIVNVDNTKTTINNMLKSLDNVVLILFAFSGILSFVVLYNISYINISERRREIASLKVLGYYDYEVDSYIIKENFIITIMGILLGISLGKIFVYFIVSSIEMDIVQFLRIITLTSYIKTFLFMISFTIIVSIIIHFTLKKIDMISSLKSIE